VHGQRFSGALTSAPRQELGGSDAGWLVRKRLNVLQASRAGEGIVQAAQQFVRRGPEREISLQIRNAALVWRAGLATALRRCRNRPTLARDPAWRGPGAVRAVRTAAGLTPAGLARRRQRRSAVPPGDEMSFFSKILDKLGLKPQAPTATAAPAPAPTTASPGTTAAQAPAPLAPAAAAPSPQPIAIVDVVEQLERRAAANPQKLNWRTSIVDLLKLLDLDSSLAARKELATELRCPPELMNDSAQMNMWLHKRVLAEIAVNGGKVPPELIV
jgi:hypothetical protein